MLNRLRKLQQILFRPFFLKALLRGVVAGTEHLDVLRALNCKTVVDIGANRGQFALAARYLFPQAKVHSYEPLRTPARTFCQVFQSDPGVSFHRCAIGPSEMAVPMHVSLADDSSSLLPISEKQTFLHPGTKEGGITTVEVKPLRMFLSPVEIEQPALLKLDVQGYELQALIGCQDLLINFSCVYVECSFMQLYIGQPLAHQVIDYLYGQGFILFGVYNMYYDQNGLAVQGDFLFCRDSQ